MTLSSLRVCLPRLSLGIGILLASASPDRACGPDFPNTYFAAPDTEILASPEGLFEREITRLPAPAIPLPKAEASSPSSDEQQKAAATLRQDVADVRHALADLNPPSSRAREIGNAYEKARGEFSAAPEGLPEEFARYYAGAIAWHQGKLDDARMAWTSVLALPEDKRRHRSTWASYMLGRLEQRAAGQHNDKASFAKTSGWFQQTRTFAAGGFPDPLGLAAASYGWEAQAAVVAGDYPSAFYLYRLQLATGDESAFISLANISRRAIEQNDADLTILARDELSRRILTAYLISRSGLYTQWGRENSTTPAQAARWATVLAQAGLHDLPDADRLAWIAYEGGLFPLAEKWASLAPSDSSAAEWIRAKLALRKGDLPTGEIKLRSALAQPGLADEHRERLLAELGRVCLSENKPVASLDAWMTGDHWEDAAYVAEHVLTTDELCAYVDAHCPSAKRPQDYGSWWKAEPPAISLQLRHLLARRLARANRFDQAAPYFPEDLRSAYNAYVTDTRAGFNITLKDSDRAAAFWRAAQALHDHGMDLIGTELEPDWAIFGGDFDCAATVTDRRNVAQLTGSLLAPTPEELNRLAATPGPAQRFHYRLRAADLAWWAAALMPNNSDETARILDQAGRWLKNRYPKDAKRFYEALAIRCGNTTPGRAAAQNHWFPPVAPETPPTPAESQTR